MYIHTCIFVLCVYSRSILAKFSWLAVLALAESADIACTPVRLGVSKPMGASSVSAEYNVGANRPSASSSYRMNRYCIYSL